MSLMLKIKVNVVTSKLIPLSEQNLLDCSSLNFGCNGGNQFLAFDYIRMHHGIDTEQTYPYIAQRKLCQFKKENIGAKLTGYVRIAKHDEQTLQSAIATIGPMC